MSRYRLLERLGEGGMGEVWKAEDTRLHRPVALKMLRDDSCCTESAKLELLREARAASALNHPNIAVIYEIDELEMDGMRRGIIVMEFVDGVPLHEFVAKKVLGVNGVVALVRQVADALAAAHARGVVHRDVKPSNVMITSDGRAKILDFGLAKYVPIVDDKGTTWSGFPDDPARSGNGSMAGTILYMSPEQARGHEIDSRTDIFSLGVVLYELLAGRSPFGTGNAVSVLDAILREEPPLLTRLNEQVSPELQQIVRRMMAKDRERRYPGMREVCADLDALLQQRERSGKLALNGAAVPESLAVMSFANITNEREDDWLGTGIAETVTADLKSLVGVTVVGRERIFEVLRKLAGPSPNPDEGLAIELGRAVGARWVVTGGYQRILEQVRITARLLDVETGAVLHTVKLDGAMSAIFELQDRIVSGLSEGMRITLAPDGRSLDETHVVAAYEAFAKGLINLRAESRESVDRAILFFERAVAFDPGFARAHLLLGSAYDVKGTYLTMSDLMERALVCFRKAIELRPTFAEAWKELGNTLIALNREGEAMEAIGRALSLAPDDAGAHGALARAYFVGMGRFHEAATEYEKALSLNPLGGWYALQLAHAAALIRDFPRGEAAARRAIELQEEFLSGKEGVLSIGAYMRLGQMAALQGRHADAIKEYECELGFLQRVDHALKERTVIELHVRMGSALLKLDQPIPAQAELQAAIDGFEERLAVGADEPYTRYYVAAAYALLGQSERALDALEKAAAMRRSYTVERARIDPDFEGLRGEKRFEALMLVNAS